MDMDGYLDWRRLSSFEFFLFALSVPFALDINRKWFVKYARFWFHSIAFQCGCFCGFQSRTLGWHSRERYVLLLLQLSSILSFSHTHTKKKSNEVVEACIEFDQPFVMCLFVQRHELLI
jgi:hypothetical protein